MKTRSFRDRLKPQGQKKLLALDGGGIRGVIALEVLARIEEILRERSGRKDLVLSDYFDYMAGTSTGAIIASCLAMGQQRRGRNQVLLREWKRDVQPGRDPEALLVQVRR